MKALISRSRSTINLTVSKMLQSDRLKLLKLEEELHKRVIGQNEAIGVVAS